MSAPLSILMVIPSLPVGGAEWAFVRLANAMAEQNQVTAYVPYRCNSEAALITAFKGVRLLSLPLPHPVFHKALYKASLTLQKIFPAFDLEQSLHSLVLRLLHRFSRFDVVNSHLRSGTLMACQAFHHTALPIVENDHGDYALLKKEDPELKRHQLLLQRVDAIICPSQYNAALIASLPWHPGFQQTVIPYPMPVLETVAARTDPIFTFGMVARGIAEKGWAEAVAAFRLVCQRTALPMRLVLVGSGACLDALKTTVAKDEPIVFAGYQEDPAGWINRFDVGLLPSYFAGESLPYSVIEYLIQGRPVIATDVGGIPEMLEGQDGPCGILVPLDLETGHASVEVLAAAMQNLAEDESLRHALATRALRSSHRYYAATCASACVQFFRRVQASLRPLAKPVDGLPNGCNVI